HRVETTLGQQQRDFLHVADVAAAFAALVDCDVTGAVNIASGHCAPVRELIDIMGRLTGRSDLLAIGARPTRPNEPPRLVQSVIRLQHEVNFTPRYSLEDGLSDTLSWWKGLGGVG